MLITCPHCKQQTNIEHIATGAIISQTVTGIVRHYGRAPGAFGPVLSGCTVTGEKSIGYWCVKCRELIARDSEAVVKVIESCRVEEDE